MQAINTEFNTVLQYNPNPGPGGSALEVTNPMDPFGTPAQVFTFDCLDWPNGKGVYHLRRSLKIVNSILEY